MQANREGYDPAFDPDSALAAQRVATFRLFLYGENSSVVPTVAEEVGQIPNPTNQTDHMVWVRFHFENPEAKYIDAEWLATRSAQLRLKHSGENDCMIIAECEHVKIGTFTTFDNTLIKNLKTETRAWIGTPVECWRRLAVPQGTEPKIKLLSGHPLVNATWWRW